MTATLEPIQAYDDTYLPTGRTTLGDYLSHFWLPRRLPSWAEGTRHPLAVALRHRPAPG